MASITVKRSIEVIAIVTGQLKEELKEELQLASEEAQRRMDQMELQSRRVLADLQRTDLNQAMNARRQLEAERRRGEALMQDIQRQLEEVGKLELDSEYPRGSIESTVELAVGDDLITVMTGSKIVVKDGVVVELREA